jgi:hypothetical protein
MELTLRDSRDRAAAWAHSVLDEARDGGPVPLRQIRRALRILGDLA